VGSGKGCKIRNETKTDRSRQSTSTSKLLRGSRRGSRCRCRWRDPVEPRVCEESARQAGQGADGVSALNDRWTGTREDDEDRWGARHVREGSILAPCRLVEGRDRARRASAAKAMTRHRLDTTSAYDNHFWASHSAAGVPGTGVRAREP
jgi:hypothetical protein